MTSKLRVLNELHGCRINKHMFNSNIWIFFLFHFHTFSPKLTRF